MNVSLPIKCYALKQVCKVAVSLYKNYNLHKKRRKMQNELNSNLITVCLRFCGRVYVNSLCPLILENITYKLGLVLLHARQYWYDIETFPKYVRLLFISFQVEATITYIRIVDISNSLFLKLISRIDYI